MTPFLPLESQIFLCRTFREEGSLVWAPLGLSSIFGCLHYVKRERTTRFGEIVDPIDVLYQNIDGAARELSMYPAEEAYEHWNTILRAVIAADLRPPEHSPEYWKQHWAENYNDDPIHGGFRLLLK